MDSRTLARGFTLDGGIRYDFEHLPVQFKYDTNDFAPRIGLAYSPSPQWALRAGFGVFFDRDLLAPVNNALQKNGVQAFEQVAYGQAAPNFSRRNAAEVPEIPFPLFVRRSLPPTQTCRPRAAKLPALE
jgi:hypothetical protein